MIGYNSFPKTLPTGSLPTQKVAYVHDYDFDYEIKQILKGAGYSEIYTYSLVSEDQLGKLGIDPEKTLNVLWHMYQVYGGRAAAPVFWPSTTLS